MPKYHVIISHFPSFEPYDQERLELARYDAGVTVVEGGPETASDDLLRQCDVLLNIGWHVPAALMDRMPACRLIAIYATGTDAVDVAAATQHSIVVCNTPLANVDDVANHAVALLLACMRRIVSFNEAVHRDPASAYGWAGWPPMHNPRGKVLGLVAFGNTARAVARKMAGFGMRIIAYDPYVAPEVAEELGVRLATLQEVLCESDYLSIHAPLTAQSRGLIGAAQLQLMKPTACIVVVSRGGVLDEAALVHALQCGTIAGAALDVQAHEPLLSDDPLLTAPNLILTPHCAGYSVQANAETKRQGLAAACRVLKGYWPDWVVNRDVKPKIALPEGTQMCKAYGYLPQGHASSVQTDRRGGGAL